MTTPIDASYRAQPTLVNNPPPEGLLAGFLALAQAHWRGAVGSDGCRSPAFDWERIDPISGDVQSVVSVCFDNSFEEWRDGHTGGDGYYGLPGAVNTDAQGHNPSSLNAVWRISMPSSGLSYTSTGIVRAIMLNTTYVNTQTQATLRGSGLMYKRTSSGEHFPWWHNDGTAIDPPNSYFCSNAASCGYQGVACGDDTCDNTLHHRIVLRPHGITPPLPLPLPVMTPPPPTATGANFFQGFNWRLVRRVVGSTWHPATDQLAGTEVYGSACGATASCTFSESWNGASFTHYLFATGDKQHWLIAERCQAECSFYSDLGQNARTILKSSLSPSPYRASWFRRAANTEDPWISLTDHGPATTNDQILYGEGSFATASYTVLIRNHNGANVFINA